MPYWTIRNGLDKGCLKTITISRSLLEAAPGICTSFAGIETGRRGACLSTIAPGEFFQACSMAMDGLNGTSHGRNRQPLQERRTDADRDVEYA